MKLPTFKRIFKTDYEPDVQDLVEKLADSLNIAIENLYTANNKRLTRRENSLATEKEFEIIVNGSGVPTAETGFQLDFDGKALGHTVERVDNITNPTSYPSSGVFLSWTQNGDRITISHVTGLTAGNRYRLRTTFYG